MCRSILTTSAGLSVMEVRSRARRLQAEVGLDLLIIDYLQLMQRRRQAATTACRRSARSPAASSSWPASWTCRSSPCRSFRRAVESRQSHVPMLSDLREVRAASSRTPTSSCSSTAKNSITPRPSARASPRSTSPSTATARPAWSRWLLPRNHPILRSRSLSPAGRSRSTDLGGGQWLVLDAGPARATGDVATVSVAGANPSSRLILTLTMFTGFRSDDRRVQLPERFFTEVLPADHQPGRTEGHAACLLAARQPRRASRAASAGRELARDETLARCADQRAQPAPGGGVAARGAGAGRGARHPAATGRRSPTAGPPDWPSRGIWSTRRSNRRWVARRWTTSDRARARACWPRPPGWSSLRAERGRARARQRQRQRQGADRRAV